MKLYIKLLLLLLSSHQSYIYSQTFLTEGFESGAIPAGWTEETVSGNEPWRFRNGGHSPNDPNWELPADSLEITRNPDAAYEGTYNAIFFKQSNNNERTKLITPELDLLGATAPELTFYHSQVVWAWTGTPAWDELRVYYKVAPDSSWVLLHEYLDQVNDWEMQRLNLPNPSETYYVAFEGQTHWGFGTCVDNISIEETVSEPLYIGEVAFEQPLSTNIPSGTRDLPIMQVELKVFGNTDSLILDQFTFTSLNTSDTDIEDGGVKLYTTSTKTFNRSNLLGSPVSFSNGVANFTGLNHSLPAGRSYLWLACDVALNATHGDTLDVMVEANAISAGGLQYPESDQSPVGHRVIHETRYYTDFEGPHSWSLTGEFEVNTPNGGGGSPGNPNPTGAFSGTRSLGTDITGLGANPYKYEPGLSDELAYTATSPSVDVLYYKNLNLFFQRHLNIEVWDSASIEVTTDDGVTWNLVWKNNSYVSDGQWSDQMLNIPDKYARSEQMKFRYKLGPTDGVSNYSGWNIDDVYLTGEFISKDVGVSEWIAPLSGSGHTTSDSVTVRIKNYGGAEITDPIPVAYSINGGATWSIDYLNTNIPVRESVDFTFPSTADLSEPGERPSVLAKTVLPGDQFTANDQFSTSIYIVPTYTPPYLEDFESGQGFWRSLGNGLWEYGDHSGSSCWATGISSTYGDLLSQPSMIIFEDGFETDRGWLFSGEFKRETPNGFHIPNYAYEGLNCIGTDLSGLGAQPYQYENGITTGTAYTATTPALEVSHYSNLTVDFAGWINIQYGDSIRLEVSPDNGATWHTIWKNSEGEIMDAYYTLQQYAIPDSLTLTDLFRLRFSLFHSSAGGPVASGWFIDDFRLLGDLVESAPAYLSSPRYDLTGISKPVVSAKLRIDTEQDVDGAALNYSLDDGETWIAVTNASGYDTYWNWYTGNHVSALGMNGWSGQSNGWISVTHLLPVTLANKDNVQLMFTFAADKSNNQFDGIAVDDVQIMEAPADLDIIDILDPVSACDLSSEQTFTLSVLNTGLSTLQAGDSVQFGYYIERSGEIQTAEETVRLTESWPVGNTRDISMSTSFDFGISGDYLTDVYFITSDPHFYSPVSNDTVSRTIEVNKPAVELGENISTVRTDTVILKAYSGVPGQSYLWQDNSIDSTFHVITAGTYYVRVTNGLGCIASDTVQVLQLAADVGVSTYLGPQSACELDNQLSLKVTIENLGTDTIETGSTIFIGGIINGSDTFEDPYLLTQRFRPGESFDFTYPRIFDFSSPDDYQLKLYTRMNGDVVPGNDTLYHLLQTFGYPDAGLGPDTTVNGSEYLLTPAPGYYEYRWQDESTGETFSVNQPGKELYHVTISDENQCTSSDTVIVTLNVQDLALDELLSPATSCELSESITVSARIRNAGNQTIPSGENINMGYRINGGSIIQDGMVLLQNLLPGHTFDFTFSNSENVQTGQWYDFTVFVDYANDSKRWNDTVITSVGVFETPALDLGEDYQRVTGFEHTLDAGPGFVSYEWQDGSSSQTYAITEPGIRLYSVTVTDTNVCTAYDETQVFLAVPDIGIGEISHPQTTCHLEDSEHVQVAVRNFGNYDIESSAEITVSYSINGAPEVSEILSLDGTFENGDVILHSFAQDEDFSQPGTYDILAYTSYESDLVPSNNIVLVSVDHFGSPVVDIGDGSDSILVYEPVTLSASPGYPSYEWQDGSTGTDYHISDPSAGWYKVIVTGDNGCATHDSVYVAYDRPDLAVSRIASPVSSCELSENTTISAEILNNGYYRISAGDTILLNYSVNGASSVFEEVILESELPFGESIILSFSEEYDFSSTGDYQVQVTLMYAPDQNPANNQLSNSITVWEGPVVDIGKGQDTIIGDPPVTLDAGAGFASYLWQDNSTGSVLQTSSFGLYWVIVTDDKGCVASDSVIISSLTSSGEEMINSGQVRIYPNPVEDVLYVALDLEVERQLTLELYSIVNALVYRTDIKRAQVTEAHINVQDLTPGTYFLRITTDKTPHHFMVIVE